MTTLFTVTLANKFGKSVNGTALSEAGARNAAYHYWTHAFGSKEPRTDEVTTREVENCLALIETRDGFMEHRCFACLDDHDDIFDTVEDRECDACGDEPGA